MEGIASTVMIDGALVPAERAVVSVFDRGFLYGDSVFESLRTYRGKPFDLSLHLARLERSAARVFIPLPISVAILEREVLQAIDAHSSVERYVRMTLTRGVGRSLGLDPELAETPLRVIQVMDLTLPPPELYERGIHAISYRIERASDTAGVADAKIGNYLLAVLAMRAARAAGAQDALLMSSNGDLLEGTTSNVFAVFGGKLLTPPENSAILPGITRAHVLELARVTGVPVELRAMPKAEIAGADEVFICSSIRELVPVVNLDGRAVGPGVPGPVTRELHRLYRAARLDA
ncbi:MAG: aminotransferase class IV [Polyangiaceae bacterium]